MVAMRTSWEGCAKKRYCRSKMAEPETGSMADVVVVYDQEEHYVQAAIEPSEGINVDLLQCQILSLVGLLPEEQILVTSRGEIISSPFPGASMALPSLPVSLPGQRERVFLIKAATAPDVGKRVPPDWREICTRCTFGDLPVVQPAFRTVGGGDSGALVCGACATTCSTDLAMVSPLDWRSSKKLARRFISELLVVAGEPDVPAPPGFSKVPGDLNYSASGDFVHLFVKRGGTRALTQLLVTHQQRGEQKNSDTSATATRLPVDCNSGSASDVTVLLSYESIAVSQSESLATYAITDVMLLVGDSNSPEGFIKIPKNLNEGCQSSEAVFIAYKLAPLGGFVCTPTHGAFGECLFQSRHAVRDRPLHAVIPAGCSPQTDTVLASLDSARERADNAFLQDHYRQHEPGMRSRLQGGIDRVKAYEDPRVQAEALKRIPVETLHERARANPTPLPSYRDELAMQLTHWFKREFFAWMNQPKCSMCANEKTRIVRTDPPSTPEEKAGQAGRVEVYQCSQCQGFTRFPRYNDPVKLLDTRVGRCGEWANCFTLCCRAMGFEARYVLDVTDHVWTEIYSEHHKRWLHCDSCEDQLDRPLTYEVGWGKKLSYIFSFSHEEVVDTAQRYTQNWDDMKLRRSEVSEPWLASTIEQMNQNLRQNISPDRIRVLDQRAIQERAELNQRRTATAEEVQGRVSGSSEWKSQRQEDGSTRGDDKGASTVDRHLRRGTDTPTSIAELLQTLVKRMLLGCDRGSDCKNMSCLHKRSLLTPEMSPTDRTALALQEAAAIQSKNLSVYGLASLLCPPAGSIQDFVLSQDVRVYLPLQDSQTNSSSSTVVDISGSGHHAQSTGPLRKPFRLAEPTDGRVETAFGLQLLPGRRLTVPIPTMDRFTISWLVRFDPPPFDLVSTNGGIAISIDIGGESPSASVRVRDEGHAKGVLVVEATSDDTLVKSAALVKPDSYYHFSIVVDQGVTVLVNAKQVVRTEFKTQESFSSIVFQSPALMSESKLPSSPVPVICHVAVLADVGEQTIQTFNKTLKERYVCWPPLQAYDASGVRTDKTCHQLEAALQLGYRVCRVRMWGSEFFDGIQLVYEKSNDSGETVIVEGPLVGNRIAHDAALSPTVEFALLPHEYLSGLAGRKGAWTDSILLETNFGRRFACGGNGGGEFRIDLSPHTMTHAVQIRAIQFDVGDHLVDAIAFVAEAPVAIEDETYADLRRILDTVETPKQTQAINAVTRYLENIVASPNDLKYQRIRASNKFFASSVGSLAEAEQQSFMEWCGFEAIVEAGDTFYVYQPTTVSSDATICLHYLKRFTTNK